MLKTSLLILMLCAQVTPAFSQDLKIGPCRKIKSPRRAPDFLRPFTKGFYRLFRIRRTITDPNYHATVNRLILDRGVVGINLSDKENIWQINVITDSSDPENDVLTYNYAVTGGKIIGVGAKVVWDHTDSPAGKYSITVGVDDGIGICGTLLTQSITVVK